MSQVIGILSGKGGVGKTSLATNVGAALANGFKKNVVIVDANINTPHIGLHLGFHKDPQNTLSEILNRNMSASNVIRTEPITGVKLIPASLKGGKLNFTTSKMKNLTRKLSEDHELVLVDCSPGLGKEVVTSIAAIDAALLVTTPDFPSLTDVLKTANLLQKMGKKIVGIVVNRHKSQNYELTEKEIESTCATKVISVIPEDSNVPRGISKGIPAVVLSPYSGASIAFKQLAGRLIGKEYKSSGLLERIMNIFSQKKN